MSSRLSTLLYQRFGQRDVALLPRAVCCRAESFYPVLQLNQVSGLPCPHYLEEEDTNKRAKRLMIKSWTRTPRNG